MSIYIIKYIFFCIPIIYEVCIYVGMTIPLEPFNWLLLAGICEDSVRLFLGALRDLYTTSYLDLGLPVMQNGKVSFDNPYSGSQHHKQVSRNSSGFKHPRCNILMEIHRFVADKFPPGPTTRISAINWFFAPQTFTKGP